MGQNNVHSSFFWYSFSDQPYRPESKPRYAPHLMTFYRPADASLREKGGHNDPQAQRTTVEVLTTLLVAACFYANNLRFACDARAQSGLVVQMLSESPFSRRRHRITPQDWQGAWDLLSQPGPADTFAVDSCPLAVCHKRRASRSKL